MKKFLTYVIEFFLLLSFSNVFAQVNNDGIAPTPITGMISAKCTVLSPISITSMRDLDFGNDILPGVERIIDKASSSSGKFSFTGESGKEVSVTFSLPPELTSGEYILPVTFSPTDAGYQITGGALTDFDPYETVNATLGTDGIMDVYLGGKVSPDHNQPAGYYEGIIVITLYYTGN